MPRYSANVGYVTRAGNYRQKRFTVTAPTISEASELAADAVRNDKRHNVRDVRDIDTVLMKEDV